MAAENLFMKNLKERGLVDDREVAAMADISCTNGNRGRAFALLSGTTLYLYEPAGFAELGDHVETLELKEAKFLKASSFPLYTYLKLEYKGHTYTFKGFGQAAKFIEAIKGSCG